VHHDSPSWLASLVPSRNCPQAPSLPSNVSSLAPFSRTFYPRSAERSVASTQRFLYMPSRTVGKAVFQSHAEPSSPRRRLLSTGDSAARRRPLLPPIPFALDDLYFRCVEPPTPRQGRPQAPQRLSLDGLSSPARELSRRVRPRVRSSWDVPSSPVLELELPQWRHRPLEQPFSVLPRGRHRPLERPSWADPAFSARDPPQRGPPRQRPSLGDPSCAARDPRRPAGQSRRPSRAGGGRCRRVRVAGGEHRRDARRIFAS
jgi:hypothetical protein